MGYFRQGTLGNCIGGVDRLQPVLAGVQQGKSSDSEEGVENVHCVARSVADSSVLGVLTVKDKVLQSVHIYPVLLLHHAEGGIDPPGVANIRQFLWPAVKAALCCLPLAKPFCQQLLVELVDATSDLESAYTAENVCRMRFRIRYASERTIEVTATQDVLHSLLLFYSI